MHLPQLTRLGVALATAYLAGCSGSGSTTGDPGGGGAGGNGGAGGGGTGGKGGSAGAANGTCGGQTCGPGQYCCGPSECGFCAAEGTGPFCGFSCSDAGAGGSSAGGGGGGGTGGQNSSDPDCTKPSGSDVTSQDYSLPPASGCSANFSYGSPSVTVADEATFRTTFNCPPQASSGIDFSTERLRVTVFSSLSVQPRKWAVETDDGVHVGFDAPPACGGALPPSLAHLTLLAAGSKPVVDDLCSSSCNFGGGGGGFPP